MCNVLHVGMLQTCLLFPVLHMLLVLGRRLEPMRMLGRRL